MCIRDRGSSEYAGKVEVEYLFLLVGELHVDVAHRSGDGEMCIRDRYSVTG